jgi:branched-chain amino acid transport system permease protein
MLDNLQLLFVYAPVMNVQMILDGIFIGAVFALAAYGLALVWGVMNVKNLAQGDFVIMGGYLAFTANNMGFHPDFGSTRDCSTYVRVRGGSLQSWSYGG